MFDILFFCPFCVSSAIKTTASMEFDHEKGIWLGSKARIQDTTDYPSPLYLFGYGRYVPFSSFTVYFCPILLCLSCVLKFVLEV